MHSFCPSDEPQSKRGQFYNDMTNLLTRFKEACRIWSNARSQEAQSVDVFVAFRPLVRRDLLIGRFTARSPRCLYKR